MGALIYAGDEDYICNWLGNMKWTMALDWPHKAAFNAAKNKDYKVGNKTVAKVRSSNGFTFMQVFYAGHLVPMDQPAASLQMVKDHLANTLESTTLSFRSLLFGNYLACQICIHVDSIFLIVL